jgi:hypothetical protein
VQAFNVGYTTNQILSLPENENENNRIGGIYIYDPVLAIIPGQVVIRKAIPSEKCMLMSRLAFLLQMRKLRPARQTSGKQS